MQHHAVIVAGSAGNNEMVNDVLGRAGFSPPTVVPSAAQAYEALRSRHVDVLILSVQGADAGALGALEREIGRSPGTFVIGTASEAAPDLILRAMRAGVHEFLVSPPSADDLAGAVERLLRRVRVDSGKRLTVAVYSAKGGLGTTTIAVNLAFAFAARDTHQRVALADFVVSGGDAGMMLDLRPSYDIGDLALKLDRIDGSLLESILSQAPGRVSVLPASERPETLETVDGAAAATILKELRGHYPVTVVDCEHHPSDRMLAALDAADRVVLVTQLNVAAMRSAQRTLALCRRLGYPDEKLLIVANRTHATDLVSAADAAKVLERELFFRLPNDYEVCTAALTRGLPVVKHEPNSSLARAFGTLAAKIGGDESDTEIENRTNGQKPRLSRLFGIGRK